MSSAWENACSAARIKNAPVNARIVNPFYSVRQIIRLSTNNIFTRSSEAMVRFPAGVDNHGLSDGCTL